MKVGALKFVFGSCSLKSTLTLSFKTKVPLPPNGQMPGFSLLPPPAFPALAPPVLPPAAPVQQPFPAPFPAPSEPLAQKAHQVRAPFSLVTTSAAWTGVLVPACPLVICISSLSVPVFVCKMGVMLLCYQVPGD